MKYEPLERFLADQSRDAVPMTFDEIEKILGKALPPSARTHRPWWGNRGASHVHERAWLEAGYRAENIDMERERLVFRRIQAVKNTHRPPLHGALRNLVQVQSGKLTDPAGELWSADAGRLK
ncbi:DUF7662 domain-containing protein [Hyphobacterium marinum]|uniref:DUF7662 domain-containing protein n=1 Tax=Hyphobacterium marinum TaxID=3116574 RepID=A0ABU7LZ61_9PROT|nr:hypothetical protein [Hyphobacterium sp. Y6023]MEE2566833.1 hypothetical protein [Hyphobacterium sp. Y6023]